jgi:uroporphyrin-III C-methyltransferase/precorrin-2 dehydrogenase/sirohydrochlorin ferrochelatase/uroporphyrin-III C-methyltransferase
MALIPPGVSRISVGKSRGCHSVPQEQINRLLVDLAESGRRVVRLKGGDPYLFGRGGEEALELCRSGIAFDVVPGITAAAGISSYAGIPLTHRGLSHGVRFVTGQLCNGEADAIDWRCYADPGTTLVIYMGLAGLSLISERLIEAGLDPATPAAAIHNGTLPTQKRVICDLADLPAEVANAGLPAPVTTIIGEVVRLSHALDWFQSGLDSDVRDDSDEMLDLARA